MKKIRALIEKYYDILSYLFFGVLTTVVNYLIYLPCYNIWGLSASVSNVIAWVGAVAFAYLTNKPFVFKSHDWSAKTVIPELTKFVGCRLGSGAMETAIIFVSVDCLGWDGNVMKLVTSILVIIVNYLASKLVVFRNK
ncbi:MAG: GtrA family protein [Oscillospiraceae bacterium]|nr:GtrA family protein [Oscillospiraceae bacterium]